MANAYKYVYYNGINTWKNYPFIGKDGNCSYTYTQSVFTVGGYVDVKENDPLALKAAVAINPVSVGINASADSLQFYTSGVFDQTCSTEINHAVTIVGYGSENGKD